MDDTRVVNAIKTGATALGIELGSTRIKATLIELESCAPISSGGYAWENRLEDGIWTYSLDEVWKGLQGSFAELARDVRGRYGIELAGIGAIGISAMMHGYLVFDGSGRQLVPFRTWRNSMTGVAAAELSELFGCNIPQRWAIAHLYHAMLGGEAHLPEVRFMTSLAGYVHWKLTGEKVLGLNDASGLIPLGADGGYDRRMVELFDEKLEAAALPFRLDEILPVPLPAGAPAGQLTAEGARLLDPTGTLCAGIPFCPPEGDVGTGMIATNSIRPNTSNISAGTSTFLQVALEKRLSRPHPEIDTLRAPDGCEVAMVHGANCTCELDAWVKLVREALALFGTKPPVSEIYDRLYLSALEGEEDCGGIYAYNYLSGEHITEIPEGRPLLVRTPESRLSLANFMRAQLFSAFATVRLGMDILEGEGVKLENVTGHGGIFKGVNVGQRVVAAALRTPVTLMSTAGEGGSWGVALLAAYLLRKNGRTLADFLDGEAFADSRRVTVAPEERDVRGYAEYMKGYAAGLELERAAADAVK